MKRIPALVALALAAAVSMAEAQRITPQPTPAPTPSLRSPGETLIEQEEAALAGRSYTYDPAGRRDPFRSLLVRPDDRALLRVEAERLAQLLELAAMQARLTGRSMIE